MSRAPISERSKCYLAIPSFPLHSPRRHLQQPPDLGRCVGRHLHLQGLSPRGPRAVHDHDAGARRVHSPVSPTRPAQGLPPHQALRPARQWRDQARRKARPCTRAHRCGTSTHYAAPATTSNRHLRGYAPSTRPRPSLSALRVPHGDHRGLRGGLSLSPPSLRAGINNREQIPIAPADRGALHLRFRSLAAFERRPNLRVARSVNGPASETLHNSGPEQVK